MASMINFVSFLFLMVTWTSSHSFSARMLLQSSSQPPRPQQQQLRPGVIVNHSQSITSSSSSSFSSSSCPNDCYCDENGLYVSCIGDSADWDSAQLPLGPSSAVRLEIRNFNLRTLTADHLASMSELNELKLQLNGIQSVTNGSFASLNKLQRLDLSENLIENFTSATFNGLQNSLRYLDLSSNRLKSIDDSFLGFAEIEQLNLHNNRLSNLSLNSFIGLVKLQYLNIG